jgi:diketogulonate reductase-like aldo/keto reductase
MNSLDLSNGVKIPAIGFGTWEVNPEMAAQSVVDAIESGYRLIDTAKIYTNEKEVGEGIRAAGIPREELFITTKLWNDDQGYDSTRRAFDASLEALGLDYLDLYLIHWPATKRRNLSWRAMVDMYNEGLVKSIGVSNFTIRHLEELREDSEDTPLVNQVEFHPYIYEQQKALLNYCYDHKITIEAYSPLARGTRKNDKVVSGIAKSYDKTTAQVLLRWCIQHGTIPLPRSTQKAHIEENFNVFDFELSPEDMLALNVISDGKRVTWDPEEMP